MTADPRDLFYSEPADDWRPPVATAPEEDVDPAALFYAGQDAPGTRQPTPLPRKLWAINCPISGTSALRRVLVSGEVISGN